jgi:beta-lactamase class D
MQPYGTSLSAFTALSLVYLAAACGPNPQVPPVRAPEPPLATEPSVPATTAPRPDARLIELPVRARPELGAAFEEERVNGGIALYDSASGEVFASNPELARRPFHPASTFKIPHAAIALELGVLDSPDSPMPWDGEYSKVEEWNRDHTLRTAMQVSCLPCFRRLARTLGPEREQEWLRRLDYGNRDASGPADLFWITGKLRVTAVEQLDFLRRLDTGKLPLSPRTLDIVRDVLALDVTESYVLYGKTGLSGPPEADAEVGWFVGFVALEQRSVYFATLVTGRAKDVDMVPVRRRVTERVLRSLAVLPAAAERP